MLTFILYKRQFSLNQKLNESLELKLKYSSTSEIAIEEQAQRGMLCINATPLVILTLFHCTVCLNINLVGIFITILQMERE